MRFRNFALALCLFFPVFVSAFEKSVVQIFNESAEVDLLYPWQIDDVSAGVGTGIILSDNRILTAAHVVNNNRALYVRKVGGDTRYAANVSFISDERDLALITIRDTTFFEGTSAIHLGEPPKLGQEVVVWGFPLGGQQLAITKGIVSRVSFDEYVHAHFDNLVVQVDAAINGGASGGPAIVNGKLAGVSFQVIDEAENVGYIIPISVVRQFLTDVADGSVDGVPEVSIFYQAINNAQHKKYRKLSPQQSGVEVIELSGFEKESGLFQVGDVLLSIDGEDIANDGTVSDGGSDRIVLDYIIHSKQIGESVIFQVLRDARTINIEYPLVRRLQEVYPVTRPYSGFIPDFEIVGGFVFQELSVNYVLNAFEKEDRPRWMEKATGEYQTKLPPIKERAVFLSSRLPHEFNSTLNDYEDKRATVVNGVEIDNLDDFRRAIADSVDEFIRIDFEEGGYLVIERDAVDIVNQQIAEQYGLPQ